MAALPGKTIALGNPPASDHQINPTLLATWMTELEALAGSGALSYIDNSLTDLEARTGVTDGEYGIVLNAGDEGGTYEYQTDEWVKVAGIPTIMAGTLAEISLLAASWTELSTITGSRDGQPAVVSDSDTEQHTDPVTDATVFNYGSYAWREAESAWERVGEVGDIAAAAAYAAQLLAEAAKEASETAQAEAEAAQAGSELAEDGAEAAQAASEAARDLSETYAGITHRAPTWTALAAISGTAGDYGYVGPEDAGTHTDPVASGTVPNEGVYLWDGTGLGSAEAERIGTTGLANFNAQLDRDGYSFPRDRSKYGMVYMPSVFTNSASEVTFTGWNTAQITTGSGNDYRAVFSLSHSFVEAGATLVFFIRVDSGSHSAPILYLTSTDRGSETITFTQERAGFYVAETVTPSSGFSAVTAILTSSDASNPVVCSKFMWAIKPSGATGIRPEYEATALQSWVMGDYQEGPGNLWSVDKGTLSVTSGDGSESVRATGITVDNDEEFFVACYIEDEDGNPANVDRAYIRAASFVYNNTSEIIYLDPVADYPGVYAKRAIFDTLENASLYVELIIDNAQTITAYTQKAVTVKAVQIYKKPPASFFPPSALSYTDSDEIVAHVYDGVMNVFTPTFTTSGNRYICWQPRRFDATGGAYGGGVGSVLEEIFLCNRVGPNAFKPIYDGTDVGLNGFAIKKDDTVDDFVGGDVHTGQARRASPQLLIDDVAVTHGARKDYICSKVELREFYELYSPTDGTTVFCNVDTVQIWEGNTFKVTNTFTYQSDEDLITDYTYMLSPKLYWDDAASNGAIWETITMPDQSDAAYTPGGGVNATYPSESHFQMADSTNGLNWDVEVQGSVPGTFRSWIQAGAGSRKLYMASKAITDSSGLVGEQGNPVSVSTSEVVEIEVHTTVTDSA